MHPALKPLLHKRHLIPPGHLGRAKLHRTILVLQLVFISPCNPDVKSPVFRHPLTLPLPQALEHENEQLRGQLSRLQDQLEMALSAQESQHKVLDTLNMQLGDKIAELQGIHTELHQAIQT